MSEQILKDIKMSFDEFKAARDKMDAEIKAKMDATGERVDIANADVAKKFDEAAKKVQSLADRLIEAEQKMVAGIHQSGDVPKSLGQMIADSDEYKSFASGKTSKIRVETDKKFSPRFSTITGQAGSPPANSNILVGRDRLAGIIPGAFRSLKIRDLVPSGQTSSNMIEYTRELAFTNQAAETAEGVAKPETDLTFELATAPVRTIAHWLKVSRQVIDDAPALASYVNNRLGYGVALRVDNQLLNGAGTGQTIAGMTIAANRTAFTPLSGALFLDSINRAIYACIAADYAPTAIVLNPANFSAIERAKVGAADDRYVIGDPKTALGPTLWGLPVILSNHLTAGNLLVAAFDIAYQVWERSGIAIELTGSNDTDFVQNLITIRAEERLALASYRPASAFYGALTV